MFPWEDSVVGMWVPPWYSTVEIAEGFLHPIADVGGIGHGLWPREEGDDHSERPARYEYPVCLVEDGDPVGAGWDVFHDVRRPDGFHLTVLGRPMCILGPVPPSGLSMYGIEIDESRFGGSSSAYVYSHAFGGLTTRMGSEGLRENNRNE